MLLNLHTKKADFLLFQWNILYTLLLELGLSLTEISCEMGPEATICLWQMDPEPPAENSAAVHGSGVLHSQGAGVSIPREVPLGDTGTSREQGQRGGFVNPS